jgi:hypothetical protein
MSWKRSQQRKNNLIKLYKKTRYKYGCGVWYDADANRYYRYYISGHGGNCNSTKFLKQQSRRKVRRCSKQDFNPNRGYYRKMYDLWWELL